MPAPRKWTEAQLIALVPQVTTVDQLLQGLGLSKSSWHYRNLRRHCERLGLDLSHFRGQGWAKGWTLTITDREARSVPLDQVLVRGRRTNTNALRARLILLGMKKAQCEWCLGTEWRGAPIPLELDHVDGDKLNNQLDNLRVLCPNCHAQTETYAGKNIGRKHVTPM